MRSELFLVIMQGILVIPYLQVAPKRRQGISTIRCVITQNSADRLHKCKFLHIAVTSFLSLCTSYISHCSFRVTANKKP